MHKSTVLVTGSNGFIGSHAAAGLRDRYHVVGVSTGAYNTPGNAHEYHQMRLPSPGLEALVQRHKPKFVLHCAGSADVSLSMGHPDVDFGAGPVTLFQIADAVRRAKLDCTILFPSSAAVYGNPTRNPIAEDAPATPISPYGHHKVISEAILREFREIYGVKSVVLRIFSCYGPGLRRMLLWDVCRKIAQGQLDLYGTGRETRDYIHVDDLVQILRLVMEQGVQDATINVANGEEVEIRHMVELLRQGFGEGAPPAEFSLGERKGDPQRWRADISKLEDLGYAPQMSLKQGVLDYAHWYRSQAERSPRAA